MLRIRVTALAAVTLISIFTLSAPVASAQSTDMTASSPNQVNKAQRKAARKAVRAKKNAELKTLEQNGYHPGSDQVNYPQNIQDAEKKAAAAKTTSGQ